MDKAKYGYIMITTGCHRHTTDVEVSYELCKKLLDGYIHRIDLSCRYNDRFYDGVCGENIGIVKKMIPSNYKKLCFDERKKKNK